MRLLKGNIALLILLSSCSSEAVYVPSPQPICDCYATAQTVLKALQPEYLEKCNTLYNEAILQVQDNEEALAIFEERYAECR